MALNFVMSGGWLRPDERKARLFSRLAKVECIVTVMLSRR